MPQESYQPAQNLPSIEKIQTPERKPAEADPSSSPTREDFSTRFADLKTEQESTLGKMNTIRESLGLPATNELPVYLVDKEQKLNELALNGEKESTKEYLDFEMVKEEKKQEVIVERKLTAFYTSIQEVSVKEYQYIKLHGTYMNGSLFESVFGILQPAIIKKLITFYESNQTINLAVVHEFIKEEPEVIELVAEEIQSEATLEDQKLLEDTTQNKIEETIDTPLQIPESVPIAENMPKIQLDKAA